MKVRVQHSNDKPGDLLQAMDVDDFLICGIDHDMRAYSDFGQLERADQRARMVEDLLGSVISLLCERGIMSPADLDSLVSHPELTPIAFERGES